MSETLTPEEQMAFPFLKAAIRIDSAKQNPTDKDLLAQVMDDNVALWLYLKNLLASSGEDINEDTRKFLVQASEFMIKAAQILLSQVDEDLMDRLVSLNLNMSELLLKKKA